MSTDKLSIGLCQGRHPMPVADYIFPNVVTNPFDYPALDQQVQSWINANSNAKNIALYVTGLTPVLIEAIKVLSMNDINVVLMHFNIATGNYEEQSL